MRSLIALLWLVACGAPCLQAQVSAGGTPPSMLQRLTDSVPSIQLPAVDHAAWLAQDALEVKEVPLRFGVPLDTLLDLRRQGIQDVLPEGSRFWRLRIQSPGAFSLNLLFNEFRLPPKARLFIYNDDGSQIIGAFTEYNNKSDGLFATQPIAGDALILEYEEPTDAAFPGVVRIGRVVHAYRNLFGVDADRDYGDSGACNINVNCPEGLPWQTEIRSVAMILTGGGFRICSGALVNNTEQDLTPYFLTANHCLGGETSWIFMFNYQSMFCGNQNGPTTNTVQGCIRRAALGDSDFALLELTETIPDWYGVVYSGWSAVDLASPNGTGIHHPSGDIKKISFELQPLVSDRYLGNQGVVGSHWRVTQWDDGTTEGGSSGSPIFDSGHHIVGQLHGGYASCTSETSDWYGKFSMSWNRGSSPATRLVDWLDPSNSGLLVLDSLDPQNMMRLEFAGSDLISDDDNDGVAEPGETLALSLRLQSQSTQVLPELTGTLFSDSPWLQVTQSQSTWPPMAPGQEVAGIPPVVLTVSPEAPLVHTAALHLMVGAAPDFVNLPFTLEIGRRAVYWHDSLETGGAGWQHQAAEGWADAWHLSTQDASSPTHSWKCGATGTGNYANLLDARLESPDVLLHPWSMLRFMHRIQAEVSGSYPDSAYDGGVLELSVDGGGSWTQLTPVDGYTHFFRGFSSASHPFPGLTPCWSGDHGWRESRVDLSAWAGQPARLRFRFGSDSGVGAIGWFIDDVVIEGQPSDPGLAPVTDLAIAWLGNGQLRVSWSPSTGATAYRVEYRHSLAEPWLSLQTVAEPGLTLTAIPDQRLFRVIAIQQLRE